MFKQFGLYLNELGKSEHTIRAYLSDLNTAKKHGIITETLSICEPEKIMGINKKPASQHRMRASIRKYAQYLVIQKVIDKVPEKINALSLPVIRHAIPKMSPSNQTKKLLEKISDVEIKLIIQILATTGCRISSLSYLKIEDFSDTITFTMSKGGKPYISILADEVKKTFNEFIGSRTSGYLFLNNKNERSTSDTIRIKLRRYLGDNYVNPHQYRHGLATELLTNGATLSNVKEFLNHSSVTVTENYIHLAPQYIQNKIKDSHPLL